MWQKMSVLESGSAGPRTDEHQQRLSLTWPLAEGAGHTEVGQSRPSTQVRQAPGTNTFGGPPGAAHCRAEASPPGTRFTGHAGKCSAAFLCCHPPQAGPLLRSPPAALTPRLSPHELQVLRGSKVLLDGVVHTLDEHARQVGALQQVGHGGAVPKGVNGPARPRRHAWGHRDPSAPLVSSVPSQHPCSPPNSHQCSSPATGAPRSAGRSWRSSGNWPRRASPSHPSPSPAARSQPACEKHAPETWSARGRALRSATYPRQSLPLSWSHLALGSSLCDCQLWCDAHALPTLLLEAPWSPWTPRCSQSQVRGAKGPSLTPPHPHPAPPPGGRVRQPGQPYLRTAARFWALMLSHHLEKKEISDQMKRRRGSSCIFSTMLLRMCCVWS